MFEEHYGEKKPARKKSKARERRKLKK